jgi:hypothetical protein
MSAKLDPEVRAIRAILRELEPHDAAAVIRIFRYVLARRTMLQQMREHLCQRRECQTP